MNKITKQLIQKVYRVPSELIDEIDDYVEHNKKPREIVVYCLANDYDKAKEQNSDWRDILEGIKKYMLHTVPREIMGDYSCVYDHLKKGG